ncbi:MAG: trypsin-like peptidase domain-containing protein [Candidatus Marinimicrobia bacterium]|nr:trypsin-like peptidase domain-containing protein [Candidatus Neomarinimicrobiota bacterium]
MFNKILTTILISLTFFSCTQYIHDFTNLIIEDEKYDTEFPHRDCSGDLEQIGNCTKMITCVGYYNEYRFGIDDQVRLKDINIINAVSKTSFNNNSAGTATIIYNEGGRVGMLTCAHIVNTPEKIITYFDEPNNDYVAAIAFLDKKMIYCSDLNTDKIEVLVADDMIDIAFLGARTGEGDRLVPVLTNPIGNSKDLNWGSFVYLFGFPRGYKMISHGIVSLSKPVTDKYFYTDSPFNRGFSGGLVLGIKDGVPNFEIVGIATSAAAEFYQYLTPSWNIDEKKLVSSFDPYEGDMFSKRLELIMYGVTQVTAIDAIFKLWKENDSYLRSKGYFLDTFFMR